MTGARDITGRPAVAVTQVSDGIRDELLFDPSSYAYLGANATVADRVGRS